MNFRLLPLLQLLALAACHDAPTPPEQVQAPIPALICTEVKKALDTLASQGGMDYKDDGQATIEHAAWLQMGDDQRDSIAHALGFHAGCVSGRQDQNQEVVVRGEDNMVLMRRLVDTRVDPMSLMRDKGGGGG
jgi:outer membrane biogenesis lipoprotein LolB